MMILIILYLSKIKVKNQPGQTRAPKPNCTT